MATAHSGMLRRQGLSLLDVALPQNCFLVQGLSLPSKDKVMRGHAPRQVTKVITSTERKAFTNSCNSHSLCIVFSRQPHSVQSNSIYC